MTKRERFMKFLANEPVDRVPVAFFHHFCGPDLMEKGLELPEAFERNIEGHREALAVFDPDVIKVMNDSLMVLPLDTSFVEKPSDLRKIQPPSVNSLFGKKTKELTQRVMEIYEGKDAPIYATGFSAAVAIARNILKEGAPAVARYKEFLSGGCSLPPVELLKITGVDLETPAPIQDALNVFGEVLDEIERLV